MARQHIYTCYQDSPTEFRCVKMERDWEVVESYALSESGGHLHCACFAGNKSTCRHRQMVGLFREMNLMNSRRAYDFDKGKWIQPPLMEV